jgi:thiamine transporter ThiT
MLLFAPPKPTKTKRIIYLIAATILGVLLSFIAHAVIESVYLNSALEKGQPITWYTTFGVGQCALPPIVQYGLLLIGLVGGFSLGRMWWRLVYIDRIWSKDPKVITNK